MFLKEVSHAYQDGNKNTDIYYELLFLIKIYIFYDDVISKQHFQHSLLKFSVSHDPSKIIQIWWFSAQEICHIIIINAENSCAA